jgi:hypothetical protein
LRMKNHERSVKKNTAKAPYKISQGTEQFVFLSDVFAILIIIFK